MALVIGIPKPTRFQDLPWGLWHVSLYFGVWGIIVAYFILFAPFDLGSWEISGESMTGPDFLRDERLWP